MDNAQLAWLLSLVVGVVPHRKWILFVTIAIFAFAFVFRILPAAAQTIDLSDVAYDAGGLNVTKAAAQMIYGTGENNDNALRFEDAVFEYEAALKLDPSMPQAMRASERAKWIRARSEGNYAPLKKLETLRRNPELASNPHAIDDLVQALASFPPGLVRIEARVFAAEAYSNRLGRKDDAVPLWMAVTSDPLADPIVVRSARKSLTTYYIAKGDYSSALDVGAADDKLSISIHRMIRRHYMHLASIGLVALMLVLAMISVLRKGPRDVVTRLRGTRALMLGYGVYVAVLGALLATGYEEGTSKPFLVFGAVLVPLLFTARAWGVAGSKATSARGMRAALCAAAALSSAFLVLENVDVAYLEGLGL